MDVLDALILLVQTLHVDLLVVINSPVHRRHVRGPNPGVFYRLSDLLLISNLDTFPKKSKVRTLSVRGWKVTCGAGGGG